MDFRVVNLDWPGAVAAGVVTSDEADLLCQCARLEMGSAWWLDTTGLSAEQAGKLAQAVVWFCAEGRIH